MDHHKDGQHGVLLAQSPGPGISPPLRVFSPPLTMIRLVPQKRGSMVGSEDHLLIGKTLGPAPPLTSGKLLHLRALGPKQLHAPSALWVLSHIVPLLFPFPKAVSSSRRMDILLISCSCSQLQAQSPGAPQDVIYGKRWTCGRINSWEDHWMDRWMNDGVEDK